MQRQFKETSLKQVGDITVRDRQSHTHQRTPGNDSTGSGVPSNRIGTAA